MRISLSRRREALTMSSVVIFASWSSSKFESSTMALAISIDEPNSNRVDSIQQLQLVKDEVKWKLTRAVQVQMFEIIGGKWKEIFDTCFYPFM